MKAIMISLLLGVIFLADAKTNYYHKTMEVMAIEDDSVILEDVHGNMWEVMADELEIGDRVECKLNSYGTSFIEDDAIVDLHKLD
jgi:hypothetical protein